MRRRAAQLRHRVGRRGAALLIFAALDTGYALRLATARPVEQTIYGWLDGPLPLWTWGLAWLAIAAVCTAGAWRGRDRVAFTAAISVKVLWCSLYLSGWLLGEVADGWMSVLFWGAFAVVVWLIAGWPEPVNGEGRPAWTPPLQ
ncbi:hypothetical protein [Micromonospora tarensis]|uniref:DUF3054 domain-containing protein n=1 Tax=Micromonospora tarensis TaxID=2806100 RepID=A0ABS1YKY4_9ACTN|nr:hypothetical protein [Micromonospora tarensis]MBM0277801.1 hypothetical protein [Micromonospora tarensis]